MNHILEYFLTTHKRHRVVYFSWNNETYLVTKIRLKHHSNHLLRGISRRNIKESLQPYRLFSPPLWRTTTYQTSCELTLSPPLVLGTRWLIWRKDETRWNKMKHLTTLSHQVNNWITILQYHLFSNRGR